MDSVLEQARRPGTCSRWSFGPECQIASTMSIADRDSGLNSGNWHPMRNAPLGEGSATDPVAVPAGTGCRFSHPTELKAVKNKTRSIRLETKSCRIS